MNNSIPLILASKSKPRRDVLFSAGICPTIRVSNVDEPAALERDGHELFYYFLYYRMDSQAGSYIYVSSRHHRRD